MADTNSEDSKDLQEIQKQKLEQKVRKEEMATWKPGKGQKKEVENAVRSEVQ
ncbi:MAG: hypothetical protein ACRBCS_12635 [Cellvibrionaceae bacterium]